MATIKQKAAVKKILENTGMAVSTAMSEVGYAPTTAKNPIELTESKGWKELMDEYLPDKDLLNAPKEALNATKIVISHTEPDKELPDHMIRLKASELGLKIKGKLMPEQMNQFNIGEMSVQFREKE